MIIDLDSWEAGYDDGLLGRPSQCMAGLDRVSYSSGYIQAPAASAISGKRSVQSLPFRVRSRTSDPSRRAISR
jgi:tRNA U34 5-methylaminomethyl-2-thiouridine-forming methyltransferase MnmC